MLTLFTSIVWGGTFVVCRNGLFYVSQFCVLFFALFLKAHVHFLSLSLSLSLTLIYLFLSFTCLWESFIYWRASSALSTIRYFEFMQILPKIIEIFRRWLIQISMCTYKHFEFKILMEKKEKRMVCKRKMQSSTVKQNETGKRKEELSWFVCVCEGKTQTKAPNFIEKLRFWLLRTAYEETEKNRTPCYIDNEWIRRNDRAAKEWR